MFPSPLPPTHTQERDYRDTSSVLLLVNGETCTTLNRQHADAMLQIYIYIYIGGGGREMFLFMVPRENRYYHDGLFIPGRGWRLLERSTWFVSSEQKPYGLACPIAKSLATSSPR